MTVTQTSVTKYQACIDACEKCLQVCNQCFNSCLEEKDAHARANCIKMLRLCADLCNLAVQTMSMDHTEAKFICNACRTICDACATECMMFKDQHCQQCAQVCHECANECANMTQM
ncbi:MAG: four-helix bundle copper-binding protein [Syntrophomonadaceae bacterium]|nr:four-helix bundle copper-binding protein [Syntrophomonadaceae bacterium]